MFRKKIDVREESDESLVSKMAGGNRNAFEELYNRYFPKLSWYANGFLKNEKSAEDVVQEVFMKLIQESDRFDLSRKFSTWIYSVTANRCKNILRDEENRQRLLDQHFMNLPDSMHISNQLDAKMISEKIRQFISDKSEKEKELFRLRFEQDLTIREIAEIMNIPEGSVKSGLFHLIKKISVPFKHIES
ncbi:MAG: sigma-70 family RNA polymerase sigma factor [Bacteroidetes bacterium]|nr:sigma-70 family RNA polymerase sigma factor [Bacteroidota bacterium]